MYHSISDVSSSPRHPYFETRTSPPTFRRHMIFLRDAGFKTLLPSEILFWLASPAAATRRAVCLTFDDAYEDFLTAAFPVLEEFGFKSTVYVPTALVGERGANGLKLLTWLQLRELVHAGVNVGSHTVSHPEMRTLSEAEIRRELMDSREALEDSLGTEIRDFSHPFAFPERDYSYVEMYRRNLDATGYRTGMTTIIGTVSQREDRLAIKRLPANDFDDPDFFLAKLNSSYDWLHQAQSISKVVRA